MTPNPNVEDDLQLVTMLSSAYTLPASFTSDLERKNHFIKPALESEKLIQKLSVEFQKPAQYHCALLYALGGDTLKAMNLLDKIADAQFFLPEVYWHLIYLEGENDDLRWKMENILGRLLPLSTWGKMSDDKHGGDESSRLEIPMSRRDWPSVPKIKNENLLKIAKLFDEMGLSKQAANAYREAIYCLAPPRLPDFGEDSWMAKNTAEYWLEIAQNEALNGDKKWAFQAVLMAVVSSSKTLPAALDIVKQLDVPPDPDLKPNPDPEKFNQIALLYTDCNLHTRALEALGLAEELLQIDLSGKKGTISSEWRKLVEAYAEGRKETCFLFGYKVSDFRPEQIIPKKFPYRN